MLEKRHLNDIRNLFCNIRAFANEQGNESLQNNIPILKEKYPIVNYFSTGFQKEILIYCFDNLINLIVTHQYKFLFDFADAVHNIPEMFSPDYYLGEYWKNVIVPLQKEYDKQLFAQFADDFKRMSVKSVNAKIDKWRKPNKNEQWLL